MHYDTMKVVGEVNNDNSGHCFKAKHASMIALYIYISDISVYHDRIRRGVLNLKNRMSEKKKL